MSWPEDRPRLVLAAVDGSPTSERAALAATEVAARHGADLLLLHVLDEERIHELQSMIDGEESDSRGRLERNAARFLDGLAAHARKRGVSCVTRIESGDPPRVIDELAREAGADLILVGKVGQRGMRSWFVGSTTRRLVESTTLPIVVIPGVAGAAPPSAGA